MDDRVAGAAGLGAALFLLGFGWVIRSEVFGLPTRNAEMTARMHRRLLDPQDAERRVRRRSRGIGTGFVLFGGALAVIDLLWIAAHPWPGSPGRS